MTFLMYHIIVLMSVAYMTLDIFLPSLVPMVDYFSSDINIVQLSISMYLLGFCIVQLFYGSFSDAYGRRKPLLIGLSIAIIGSIICAASYTIEMLIIGRIIQSLGTGAITPICRSILVDSFAGNKLAQYGSFLSISIAAILSISPFIGGYIQTYLGWRYTFILICICISMCLILTYCFLPETNKNITKKLNSKQEIFKHIKILITDKSYICYTLCATLPFAGFTAWLTAGPILLQDNLGLSPKEFGWLSLSVGLAYTLGCYINIQLIKKFSLQHVIQIGAYSMTIASVAAVTLGLFGILNVYVIIIPAFFHSFGASFIFANTFALAFKNIKHIVGIGSSIFSFIQVLGGYISSSIIQISPEINQLPMAIIFLLSSAPILFINRIIPPNNN